MKNPTIMNLKMLSVISGIGALICIVMFAGLAQAYTSYAMTITNSQGLNGGYVDSPYRILGNGPDNNWVFIYGPSANTGGVIVVQMSATVASGATIGFFQKAAIGYTNSYETIYVSENAQGPYYEVVSNLKVWDTSGQWKYFTAPHSFNYVSVYCIGSYPEGIYIDCIVTQ